MIPPCLTLNNTKYVSRLKWSNPGKGVAPSPTPQCSSYWKGSLLVALDYGCQLYFLPSINSPKPHYPFSANHTSLWREDLIFLPLDSECKLVVAYCLYYTSSFHLGRILNWIWWWGCSSRNLVSIEYHFIVINLWSVQSQYGTIYQPLRSGRIWHKVNF